MNRLVCTRCNATAFDVPEERDTDGRNMRMPATVFRDEKGELQVTLHKSDCWQLEQFLVEAGVL